MVRDEMRLEKITSAAGMVATVSESRARYEKQMQEDFPAD
jgi:hypothetical protein